MASKRGRGLQSGHTDRLRPAYIQQKDLARIRQAAAARNVVLNDEQYQCECCGNVFEKTKTDEEALREAKEKFPTDDLSNAAVVCDTCYQAIMASVGKGVP